MMNLVVLATAQEPVQQDTTEIKNSSVANLEQDTLLGSNKKARLAFYIDYLGIAGQFISNNEKYEGGFQLPLYKKFILSLEGGIAKNQPVSSLINGDYLSEGYFWKAGIDYLITQNKEKDTKVFAGLRYANGTFNDEGTYEISSTLWPTYKGSFNRDNLKADWYEVLLGTEGNLFGGLYTGWTVRYRIMKESPQLSPVPVYVIPGYGIAKSKSVFGFNFYLKYILKW